MKMRCNEKREQITGSESNLILCTYRFNSYGGFKEDTIVDVVVVKGVQNMYEIGKDYEISIIPYEE